MSQLSHLIKRAKSGNRIEDMFKTESPAVNCAADKRTTPDNRLQNQITRLESLLFDDPNATLMLSEGIIRELESIAEAL